MLGAISSVVRPQTSRRFKRDSDFLRKRGRMATGENQRSRSSSTLSSSRLAVSLESAFELFGDFFVRTHRVERSGALRLTP